MMELIWLISLVLVFYTICYILSQKLKVKRSIRSLDVPQKSNIEVGILTCKWSTTILNSWFANFTRRYFAFTGHWYHYGTMFTAVLFIPSCLILTYSAFQSIASLFTDIEKADAILQPVLPGVNIPKNELLLYLVSIFISTLVHEFGHATAAARENVSVLGVGLFVILFFPAAFVELPTAQVTSLSPWNQLKIYSAGVWHNAALAALAYAAFMSSPFLLSPSFAYGGGISISDFNEYEPSGAHDFHVGNILTSIDDCQLNNALNWRECLINIAENPSLGFCVDGGYLPETTYSDVSQCCVGNEYFQSHQCFASDSKTFFCLKARQVSESSSNRCHSSSDCTGSYSCLIPAFDSKYESAANESSSRAVRLMRITRKNGEPVLFIGTPGELYSMVHVSNYLPRLTFLGSKVAEFFETFLKYVISFSAGLGVLNLVPCYYMDGQHVANILCELLCRKRLSLSCKRKLTNVVTIFGTLVIAINLVCSFYSLFT